VELCQVRTAELDLRLGRLRQIPSGAVRSMCASLSGKGQLSPLVAARQDGVLVLIDGFVRHMAAGQLGLDTVLVEVVELDPVQMKAQVYLRNRDRAMALLEECRLVFELCELDGLSQVEVGELLERHKSWVSRRLSLYRELSPRLVEDHCLGLLGPGSVRRLSRLSPGNQERLVAVGKAHGLGSRDLSLLVELWQRATDPEVRSFLLAHPRSALARACGRSRPTAAPALGDGARRMLLSLQGLAELAERLERQAARGLGEVSADGLGLLAAAHRRAEESTRAALAACGGWVERRGGGVP
jgi:ParB family transcriptional regulator, chromosome partitioning protein